LGLNFSGFLQNKPLSVDVRPNEEGNAYNDQEWRRCEDEVVCSINVEQDPWYLVKVDLWKELRHDRNEDKRDSDQYEEYS